LAARASEISDGIQRLFSKECTTAFLQPGEELLALGQPSPGIWRVESGSLRSLACLPPSQHWRTVERHKAGDLVGWLNWIHQRPIEHLRAAEATVLRFLPKAQLSKLWDEQLALGQWCQKQTPAVEAIHLLQQLAHADHGRTAQLEQWKKLLPECRWLIDAEPTPADLDSSGQWFRPDGSHWELSTDQPIRQQRLIWLPNSEQQRQQALVKAEMGQLVAEGQTLLPSKKMLLLKARMNFFR